MTYSVQHVHVRTTDPKKTAQYYIDNFGAKIKGEIAGRGVRVDLHGMQLNITEKNADQKHDQHYGIEHLAIETTDYKSTMAGLRKNGVAILEEIAKPDGLHVAFVQGPEGSHMEIIEKAA